MKPDNIDGTDILLDHSELEKKILQSTTADELLVISDEVIVFYDQAESGNKAIKKLEKEISNIRLAIPQQHQLFNLSSLIKNKIGEIAVKNHRNQIREAVPARIRRTNSCQKK